MVRKLFFLITLFVFQLSADKPWFYLQDAGETYGLLPVMERLADDGVSFGVVTAGVASSIISQADLPIKEVYTLSDFGLTDVGRDWPRSRKMKKKEISMLFDKIDAGIFITGVAFELQGQLLEECKKRKIQNVAFWDNFSASGENEYFKIAHLVKEKADLLFVPSQVVANDLFSSQVPTVVVGHPSLERWRFSLDLYKDKPLLKGKERSHQMITYIGSYGKKYEEAFHFFLDILHESDFQGVVMVQPHPKTDGSFERRSIEGWEKDHIDLQIMNEVSTFALVSLSDLVVCYNSSVGIQALAAGKRVVYLLPPDDNYTNAAIESNAAPVVCSLEDWKQIDFQGSKINLFNLMGMPKDSVSRFVDEIHRFIEEKKITHNDEALP